MNRIIESVRTVSVCRSQGYDCIYRVTTFLATRAWFLLSLTPMPSQPLNIPLVTRSASAHSGSFNSFVTTLLNATWYDHSMFLRRTCSQELYFENVLGLLVVLIRFVIWYEKINRNVCNARVVSPDRQYIATWYTLQLCGMMFNISWLIIRVVTLHVVRGMMDFHCKNFLREVFAVYETF